MLNIRYLDADDSVDGWNDFVTGHPEGTFFHLGEWQRVLGRAFGHRTYYLIAEAEGRIRGVLPLANVRSLLFGNSLSSTPFCVYGGVLAADDQAKDALVEEARRLAERLGVGYLELRNRTRQFPEWPAKDDLYVTFRREIDPDPEANLKAIPRKQRAMVRKGIKAGLTSDVEDGTATLHRIYSESVRNLGTPVFSRTYFDVLNEVFGDRCEILTIRSDGEPVASVMSFFFRDEVLPYYGGGTGQARSVQANDFMYWEVMRRAAERGVRIFDYGRSKRDTGSYRFKKHWGFEPEPLRYEYLLVRAKDIPDVNPLNPKYRVFVETWKRLPVGLARLLGPMISKNLG